MAFLNFKYLFRLQKAEAIKLHGFIPKIEECQENPNYIYL